MSDVIASFSGGKDSTAMVLRMIEKGDKLDEVVFCDTGMEFPAMYDHIGRVKEYVEARGVKFVTLKGDLSFEDLFLNRPIESSKYGHSYHGFGFPGMYIRWCTKHLKTEVMGRYLRILASSGIGRCGITAENCANCWGRCYESQRQHAHNCRHNEDNWLFNQWDSLLRSG